jgi:hypothetical protein
MIAKISRFSIFINILSIFTAYTIQASNAQKNPSQPTVTFTSNRSSATNPFGSDIAKKPLIEKQGDEQPATQTKAPAAIITEKISSPLPKSPEDPENYEFEDLAGTDYAALAKTNPNPANRLDVIGSDYLRLKLPDQIAPDYAWSDNLAALKSDIEYLLSLINNGTYDVAYSGHKSDPKIVGRNSAGLATIVAEIAANQISHRQAHNEQLQQHRRETTDLSNKALLLLCAINKHFHPKKIDAAVLEDEFKRISASRKANDVHLRLTIEEFHKRDALLKNIQEQLNKAHLTGDKSIPISPRKPVDEYTRNLLNL